VSCRTTVPPSFKTLNEFSRSLLTVGALWSPSMNIMSKVLVWFAKYWSLVTLIILSSCISSADGSTPTMSWHLIRFQLTLYWIPISRYDLYSFCWISLLIMMSRVRCVSVLSAMLVGPVL